jgi:hypothetical protein
MPPHGGCHVAYAPWTIGVMTTSRASSRPSERAVEPRWRIGRRLRRTILMVHIISAGSWIGIDVIVGVLVLVGWFGRDPATRGIAYQALGLFVVWPMLTAGLVCLLSGLVLGLGSRWGLVRYWWVAVKLTLNLLICTLILLSLRPGMADVRAYGRDLSAGIPPHGSVSDLFFPPAVSLTALSLAVVLSVAKPWGRIRRQPTRTGG